MVPNSSQPSNRPSPYILLLLLGLGTGFFVYYQRQQEQSEVRESTEEPLNHKEEQSPGPQESQPPFSTAERITFRDQSFDTYRVSLKELEVRLFWQGTDQQAIRNLERLQKEAEEQGDTLLFGMNAGMYNPDHRPQGLYIEKGEVLVPLDTTKGKGNFYLKPNGVFLLREGSAKIVESSQFSAIAEGVLYATQSGPMLLIDGKMHPAFREGSSNRFVRNGMGIIAPDQLVFAISNQPVNFFDFASLFQERFGCENALYLDGFVSKMYLPALERRDLDGNLGPLIGVMPR